MSLFKRSDREVVNTGALVFALLAAILAFAALVTAASANDKSSKAASSGGGGSGGVQVGLSEFKLTPDSVNAPANGKLVVTNNGSVAHNLTIEGTDKKTKDLSPGQSETIDLKGVKSGMYTIYCNVPGHKEAGMKGMLMIGGSSSGVAGGGSVDPNALLASNDQSDALMTKVVQDYVKPLMKGGQPNTKGVGNQPLEPKIQADGSKEFDLTAAITDWEVSPGHTVKAWTYNGMVPGPWIKVNPNDHVKIVLKNDLPQSTAMHLHGIETPMAMDGVPDVTQPAIKPGASFTYDFVAKGPAMGMYHSHHHAEHQVPDGLVGVFQVGEPTIPAGYNVTQEYPMVLNDAGVIGLSLNGKSFPATAPVVAHVGDTVQLTYFNEGLQIHPMHLHGIPQLVIAKDGFSLPNPYMVDTLTVAPGERYTVLIRPDESKLGPVSPITGVPTGIWAFHCHILTHAEGENGMFGMVTTFIVLPKQ